MACATSERVGTHKECFMHIATGFSDGLLGRSESGFSSGACDASERNEDHLQPLVAAPLAPIPEPLTSDVATV